MADNMTIMLLVGYVLVYAILYQKNKLYGSIMFLLLGLLSYYVTDSYIGATLAFIGLIILFFNSSQYLQQIFVRDRRKEEW